MNMMHRIVLLALFGSLCCFAQIGMNLKAEKGRYLRYEPIELTLTLRNYSGNTLVFGSGKDGDSMQGRLVFLVKKRDGTAAGSMSPAINPLEGMVFAPGDTKELVITINKYFNLYKDDFYSVTAYVDHKRMPKAFVSNTVYFDVRDGIAIKSKYIGLPAMNDNDMIKSITATLLRFNDGENDVYCLRIEDEKKVYGTFRIGPFIGGSVPQLDADEASAIHVLVQIRPRLYCYSVYSIIGGEAKLRQQRYYKPDNGVPKLTRAPGYLKIIYAAQAVEGVDYKTGVTTPWK